MDSGRLMPHALARAVILHHAVLLCCMFFFCAIMMLTSGSNALSSSAFSAPRGPVASSTCVHDVNVASINSTDGADDSHVRPHKRCRDDLFVSEPSTSVVQWTHFASAGTCLDEESHIDSQIGEVGAPSNITSCSKCHGNSGCMFASTFWRGRRVCTLCLNMRVARKMIRDGDFPGRYCFALDEALKSAFVCLAVMRDFPVHIDFAAANGTQISSQDTMVTFSTCDSCHGGSGCKIHNPPWKGRRLCTLCYRMNLIMMMLSEDGRRKPDSYYSLNEAMISVIKKSQRGDNLPTAVVAG